MKIPEILKPLVKMCYYFPEEKKHQVEVKKGHIFFDDLSALKLYCLKHPFAINMPALIEKNCKVCHGTGKDGWNVTTDKPNYCYKCLIKNFNKKISELVKIVKYDRHSSGKNNKVA